MTHTGILCGLLLAALAHATLTDAQRTKVANLWAQAMLEQSIPLTCDTTLQEIDKTACKYWRDTREQTLALVTYVSKVRHEDTEWANRNSIWDRSSGSLKLRFHQGTPRKALI